MHFRRSIDEEGLKPPGVCGLVQAKDGQNSADQRSRKRRQKMQQEKQDSIAPPPAIVEDVASASAAPSQ
jgi:hypothetical protein